MPDKKMDGQDVSKKQDNMVVDRTKTIKYLKEKFSEYYSKSDLFFPDRITEREWAFLYFDSKGGMHRPVAFNDEHGTKRFLTERSPSHTYYSTAYYSDPSVPMAEKKWLGAELIFDLDADHVIGAEKLDVESQLAAVKERFIYLLDDFLSKDFIDEKEIQIVFSGSRGYHAHIAGEKIIRLNSQERREIVDYITGTGLEENWLFPKSVYDATQFGSHVNIKISHTMPDQDSPGWKGKAARGILKLFTRWESMEKKDVLDEMTKYEGIGDTKAKKIYNELFESRNLPAGEILKIDSKGKITVIKTDKIRGIDKIRIEHNLEYGDTSNDFIKLIIKWLSVSETAETDEPVTSDVKRIIRMPTSLHGKSGLIALPLTRKQLDTFEPLRDAFPSTYTDSKIKINVLNPLQIKLKGNNFDFKAGLQEVPEFAAVFSMCRGFAIISD